MTGGGGFGVLHILRTSAIFVVIMVGSTILVEAVKEGNHSLVVLLSDLNEGTS